MTDTVSNLEVLWTVINVIGSVVQAYVWFLTIGDLRAIEAHPTFVRNGLRHLQAKAQRRSKSITLGMSLAFVVVGLVAMTAPPSNTTPTQYPSQVLALILTGSAIAMMVDAVLYYLNRQRILQKIANGEDYR